MSVFGEAPDVTLSVPVIEVRLPPDFGERLREFAEAAPDFQQGAEAFAEAVEKAKGE